MSYSWSGRRVPKPLFLGHAITGARRECMNIKESKFYQKNLDPVLVNVERGEPGLRLVKWGGEDIASTRDQHARPACVYAFYTTSSTTTTCLVRETRQAASREWNHARACRLDYKLCTASTPNIYS